MLTEEQTQQLFNFVRSKYVRYYDLQVELVDHLASSIEEKMDRYPQIEFDQALKEVYASFGIFGFSKIVTKKENAIYRQSVRLWYREFLHWFKWPKIAASLLFFLICWQICRKIPAEWAILSLIFLGCAAGVSCQLKHQPPPLKEGFKLLMLSPYSISPLQIGYLAIMIPLYAFIIPAHLSLVYSQWLDQHSWIIALWATFCALTIISQAAVSRRIIKQAKIRYPAAFVFS